MSTSRTAANPPGGAHHRLLLLQLDVEIHVALGLDWFVYWTGLDSESFLFCLFACLLATSMRMHVWSGDTHLKLVREACIASFALFDAFFDFSS